MLLIQSSALMQQEGYVHHGCVPRVRNEEVKHLFIAYLYCFSAPLANSDDNSVRCSSVMPGSWRGTVKMQTNYKRKCNLLPETENDLYNQTSYGHPSSNCFPVTIGVAGWEGAAVGFRTVPQGLWSFESSTEICMVFR